MGRFDTISCDPRRLNYVEAQSHYTGNLSVWAFFGDNLRSRSSVYRVMMEDGLFLLGSEKVVSASLPTLGEWASKALRTGNDGKWREIVTVSAYYLTRK